MGAVRLGTAGYEAAGMARLGSPLVFLGFSRHLAWTITTSWPGGRVSKKAGENGKVFRYCEDSRGRKGTSRQLKLTRLSAGRVFSRTSGASATRECGKCAKSMVTRLKTGQFLDNVTLHPATIFLNGIVSRSIGNCQPQGSRPGS